MIQILVTILLFLACVLPMGHYLYRIATGQKTLADGVMNRVDGLIYRLCGIDPKLNMSWKKYAVSLVLTNMVLILVGYAILRLQAVLFLNPNEIAAMPSDLAFNTIVSFMTNTNLQHYSGESGLSYLSQMLVITMMMFSSAATGYAACMAMARGLCGREMGNYFTDMVRITTRVLLPLSFVAGLVLVAQGVPQTLMANATLGTLEGANQDIPLGPIASLVSIKHLGTNGGGFLGANSSTPFENPTAFTNLLEMLFMTLLPGACVVAFGLMAYARKKQKALAEGAPAATLRKNPLIGREGRTVFLAMGIIFLAGLSLCYFAERAGNPILTQMGINPAMGSMEGKEVRFGIAQSSLFTTITTSFTTGSVNNMHDTLTPLGGLVPLLNMMLNTVFGGIGVGLMNMLLYVILAVFLAGLMIGRTPEYLGKKIESKEMKLTVLCIVLHPLLILGFSALAVSQSAGLEGITNPGYHGLSQVLYEFSSAAANNGSGFEGLGDNTLFWNITTGLVMFFGRYVSIIMQLAIAGSLLVKRQVNETSGTLKTGTLSFGVITAFVVLVFAALTFFPALALGPIAEHLTLGSL